jgi:hypothetical protein
VTDDVVVGVLGVQLGLVKIEADALYDGSDA